jgi:hypothetical protein
MWLLTVLGASANWAELLAVLQNLPENEVADELHFVGLVGFCSLERESQNYISLIFLVAHVIFEKCAIF